MLIRGDLFDVLPTLEAESIDAGVTDPPYGIGFMGREWDTFKPEVSQRLRERGEAWTKKRPDNPNLNGRTRQPGVSPSAVEYDYSVKGLRSFQDWTAKWSSEVFRVLKPGAYLVVCGAPRSHHRMMCGLEDAGFVVRDCFAWLFGSGFPKNKNLGDGRGTALKPAHEPIALAWKPFKGSIAANVAKHGTGALNIDACRIDGPAWTKLNGASGNGFRTGKFMGGIGNGEPTQVGELRESNDLGRWPANVLLDEISAAMLDAQTGELTSGSCSGVRNTDGDRNVYGNFGGTGRHQENEGHAGSVGGASRFYYVAKPSREERDYGTEGLIARQRDESRKEGNPGGDNPRNRGLQPRGNFHPTVKPVELMRWLVKLVTPPGGTVLDPFTGSGTTGMACRYEQREFIGIEREAEYAAIAERRIAAVAPLFGEVLEGR
jgi:DNA modification methylase